MIVVFFAWNAHSIAAHAEPAFPSSAVTDSPLPVSISLQKNDRQFHQVLELAQNEGTVKPASSQPVPEPKKPTSRESKNKTSEIQYVKDRFGNEFPFSLEDILEFKRHKAQNTLNNKATLPDYSVNRVELSGIIKEDLAEITADVYVQINRDGSPFLVPLGFKEATLISFETHTTEVNKVVFGNKDNLRKGQQWWFQGKGIHHLTFKLLVPVKPKNALHNLTLSLPVNTSTRHARLIVATGETEESDQEFDLITQLPQNILMTKKKLEESGQTEVSFPIPGKDLDFSWQVIEKKLDEEAILNSETDVELEFQYSTIHINVKQTVEALTGSFDSIKVNLPKNFNTILVDVPGYLKREQDKNSLYIQLKEPVTRPLTFTYELEADIPDDGRLVLDDAFQLIGANTTFSRQTGTVKVRETQSYQVSHLPEDDNDAIYRTDVSLLKSGIPLSHAFRFYKQPFALSFKIEKIKPKVSLQPWFELDVMPATAQQNQVQVNLKAQIAMTVRKGELEEFELDWPGWESEKWEELSEPTTNLVEEVRQSETNENRFLVKFLKPQSGKINLVLNSRRLLNLKQTENKLTLPQFPEDTDYRSSILQITDAPNLETILNPQEGTLLRRPSQDELIRPVQEENSAVPDEELALRNLWKLERPSHQLFIEVQKKQQEISAESHLELTPNREHTQVLQQVKLDVNYVPLEYLSFQLPPQMNLSDFEFRNEAGLIIPANMNSVPNPTNNIQRATINFTKQLLGSSRFFVKYQVKTPAFRQKETSLQIPYLQFSSVPFERIELSVPSQEQFNLQMNSQNWNRLTTSTTPGQSVWETQENGGGLVRLVITESTQIKNQNFHISQALANVWFQNENNAQQQNRAEINYKISGKPTLIAFTLPASIKHENITVNWNNHLQSGDGLTDGIEERGYVQYLFIPDESDQVEHEFRIQYSGPSSDSTAGQWVHDYRFPLPQFEDEVHIEKTFLCVHLPHAQHLLTSPINWLPLFSWQRTGLFFYSRQPSPEQRNQELYQQLHSNLNATSSYQYDLYRFGKTKEIRIQALSQSVIVLAGAGVAFLCGFLIRKLRFLHNMLSLMMFTLLFAILGLWYWSAMQLFIQPALIGVLLAFIAVGIEEWLRRRQSLEYLDVSPSEDFVLTPVHSVDALSREVTSEGSTAIRPLSKQSQKITTIDPGREL